MMEREHLLRIGFRLLAFGGTGLVVARGLYLRLGRRLVWLSAGEQEALVRLRAMAEGRDAALASFDRAVREARALRDVLAARELGKNPEAPL